MPEDQHIFTDLTVAENLKVGRRKGNQMSGGEHQMLSIAHTLMGNPDAIRTMKNEGVAVLLSEQNWAFADRISDRACVIERGAIRFECSMAEFLANEPLRAETLGV